MQSMVLLLTQMMVIMLISQIETYLTMFRLCFDSVLSSATIISAVLESWISHSSKMILYCNGASLNCFRSSFASLRKVYMSPAPYPKFFLVAECKGIRYAGVRPVHWVRYNRLCGRNTMY